MSLKYSEKTIGVIGFSGKHDDWKCWSRKFLAQASKRSYIQIVDGMITIPTKAANEQAKLTLFPSAYVKEAIENYDLALTAYADLILLMNIKSKAGKPWWTTLKVI